MGNRSRLVAPDDSTPLNGVNIDVGARIGWALRFARTAAAPQLVDRLDDMARRLGTNSARLHRAETGRLRDGSIVDAYERELGLAPGVLRAGIDILCRTFPGSAPVDRGPAVRPDVAKASAATERVMDTDRTGATWLRWSQQLSQAGAVGLPLSIAVPLIDDLVGEMNRSVGSAYTTRYEALALMRCGPYGGAVLEVAKARVSAPHVQAVADLMSGVCESVTDTAADWMIELLSDRREHIATAGALGLENLTAIVDDADAFWRPRAAAVIDLFDDSEEGTASWQWLSHLLRLMPDRVIADLDRRPRHALAPRVRLRDWSKTRVNRYWRECDQRSETLVGALGLPAQPMIARLLFDEAVSPHETRAVTSYILRTALPGVIGPFDDHLAEMAANHDDEIVRERAARRLSGSRHGYLPPRATEWLTAGGTNLAAGLTLSGCAGVLPPEPLIQASLAQGGAAGSAAMFAVGMAGGDDLVRLVDDRRLSSDQRGAARWWLNEGSRVVDPSA